MSVLASFSVTDHHVKRIPIPVEAALLVANVNPADVVTHMSIQAGVSPRRVRGQERHRAIVDVRRSIARSLRGLGLSYPEIGRALGGRHHTTVLWLLRGGRRKASS